MNLPINAKRVKNRDSTNVLGDLNFKANTKKTPPRIDKRSTLALEN